jgi:hypothetical protein
LACTSSAVFVGPDDLSDGYVRARVDEEYTIARTCAALEQVEPGSNALHPEGRVLLTNELITRLDLLLKAANIKAPACTPGALKELGGCGSKRSGCTPAARACSEQIDKSSNPESGGADPDVLAVVGFSIDGKARTPGIAAKSGSKALSIDGTAVARRVNMSFATVMTLVAVSRRAEQLAQDLSASFGWFEGFARPLLDLAAAEVVAASMDGLLDRLEHEQKVSKASVSAQACRIYDKVDATSSVASRTLRRVMLRFSRADYSKVSEAARACAELEAAAEREGRDADERRVCKTMLEKTRRRGSGGGKISLRPRLSGRKLKAQQVAAEQHVAAFRAAAKKCLEEHRSTTPELCTLERVERVASLLAALSGSQANRAALVHASFSAVESQLDALSERLLVIERKVDGVRGEVDQLHSSSRVASDRLESTQQRLETKVDILERHLVRDAMVMAGRAGKACRSYVDSVLNARNELARQLKLRDDRQRPVTTPCTRYDEQFPAAGDELYVSEEFPGVTTRREALCGSRFVQLHATFDYDPSAPDPAEVSRRTLELLAKTVRSGDSVLLVGYGEDAQRGRDLDATFANLPNRLKQRFGERLSPAEKLAVVRAERIATKLSAASVSVSIAGRAARRVEASVLLGGPLSFDPLSNCPDWPTYR